MDYWTMIEMIECEEFSEVAVGVERLFVDGEFRLDDRIANRGYLSVTMRGGQIILRTTRYVGTIPLTPQLAVRVVPRAEIRNLSYMLVRSGVAASAISGFSRGYLPKFEGLAESERLYADLLLEGLRQITRRGYLKSYVQPRQAALWQGRLLVSETVRKYAAKGVRYRQAFEQNVLSFSNLENMALKKALTEVLGWLRVNEPGSERRREAESLLRAMPYVEEMRAEEVLAGLTSRLRRFPRQRDLYQDMLWVSYLVLQKVLPDVSREGVIPLQSLMVDVSEVFEAYVRRELALRLRSNGFRVEDGRRVVYRLFREGGRYRVQPDMVIRSNDKVVAVLDAKYKPEPKEDDRYEVIAFMDAVGVNVGGFVCPTVGGERSRMLGTTETGKELVLLRYDLCAHDPVAESSRFAENVLGFLLGSRRFF